MNHAILVLAAYTAVMVLSTVLMTKKETDIEAFCVGGRDNGWLVSALSIAATWIWAPALFTSAGNAYMEGSAGLFWFLTPNVLCLIIFIPFARRIRAEMPEGMTLLGYMYKKYRSKAVRNVYLFQLGALAVLSTGVQLLAGGSILSELTGLPFVAMTAIMAAVAYSYSQFSGIRASILTDAIQMVFMLAASLYFAVSAFKGQGAGILLAGLGGISGDYSSLFSDKGLEVFWGFGLPATIGLLSGPFGDQCFWQRAFSIKQGKIGRAFLVGAALFSIVPLSMGMLGFMGAGRGYIAMDAGMVSLELIDILFPAWVAVPFLFMVVSGLLSTVDSNLCAVSSLTADIFSGSPKGSLRKVRSSMLLLLALGIAIANIPGLTVTHLFLFYGTLRASSMLPTIMALKGVKLEAGGIIAGIVSALCLGLPVFACGNMTGNAALKTTGSLLTVLASGGVAFFAPKCRKYIRSIHER